MTEEYFSLRPDFFWAHFKGYQYQKSQIDKLPFEKAKEREEILLVELVEQIYSLIPSIIKLLKHILFPGDEKKKDLDIILNDIRKMMELGNCMLEIFPKLSFQEEEEDGQKAKQAKKKELNLNVSQWFIKELERVMEKNYSDPDFNVEGLARKVNLSLASLYRRIYELTGESPCKYIRSFRLKRAVQMLKSNSRSIADVSFEVGFNSPAYFTKCFKEKYHHCPSKFLCLLE